MTYGAGRYKGAHEPTASIPPTLRTRIAPSHCIALAELALGEGCERSALQPHRTDGPYSRQSRSKFAPGSGDVSTSGISHGVDSAHRVRLRCTRRPRGSDDWSQRWHFPFLSLVSVLVAPPQPGLRSSTVIDARSLALAYPTPDDSEGPVVAPHREAPGFGALFGPSGHPRSFLGPSSALNWNPRPPLHRLQRSPTPYPDQSCSGYFDMAFLPAQHAQHPGSSPLLVPE